jgi:hypothetical protein
VASKESSISSRSVSPISSSIDEWNSKLPGV